MGKKKVFCKYFRVTSLFSVISEDGVKVEVKENDAVLDVSEIPVEVFEAICAAFPDQGGTTEELKDK